MGGSRAGRISAKTVIAASEKKDTVTSVLGDADGVAVLRFLPLTLQLTAPPPDIDSRTRAKLRRALQAIITVATDDNTRAWLARAFPDADTWNRWREGTEKLSAALKPSTGRRRDIPRDAAGTAVALAFLLAGVRLNAGRTGRFARVYRLVCEEQTLQPPDEWDTRTLGSCITGAKHSLARLLKHPQFRQTLAASRRASGRPLSFHDVFTADLFSSQAQGVKRTRKP